MNRIVRTIPLTALTAGLLLALTACKSKQEEATAPKKTTSSLTEKVALPQDVVYAASAHLRVVDPAAGRVSKKIDLQRAVRVVEFSPDGRRAYVAASDGVRELDAVTHEVRAKLTEHPARNVVLSEDGRTLFVLEHQVERREDGTTEIMPYRLLTIDAAERRVVKREEIGQRILFAHPPAEGRNGLVVTEAGEIRLVAAGQPLSGGERIDPTGGLPSERNALRARQFTVIAGSKAYVPVEGLPSRVLEIDLASGAVTALNLGLNAAMRGLTVTPDGEQLLVDAGLRLLVVDLEKRAVSASLELPGGHIGAALSSDARHLYLAQTIQDTGGAVTVVSLDPLRVAGQIHLDDISPWAIAVRPR